METSDLLERIRDTLRQMPSGAGKMTLKGDAGGFQGWVGSWTLQGLLRDVARQLEDLQEANEDLAHKLYLRRTGEPADIEARDDGLEERVESLEEARDRRDPALGTRLGEIERDIDTLRSQVGTLLEDLYARREAEREDEEGSPLPERFSIRALSDIPGVDPQSAEAIVDHYGFLGPEELYVLSNRYTLEKLDRVSASSEWAIWKYLDDCKYLDEKDPELLYG